MNVFAESDSGGGGGGRGRIASDGGEVQRREIPRDRVLTLGQQLQREALNALIPRNNERKQRKRGSRKRIPRG